MTRSFRRSSPFCLLLALLASVLVSVHNSPTVAAHHRDGHRNKTPVPPVDGNDSVLWSSDFETGDFSQWEADWGGGIYNTGTGVASITSGIARSGLLSAVLTITSADGQHGNQAVRIFRWNESRTYGEAYYSVWYYFPQSYRPAQWWNVFQFKSKTSTRNDAFWQLNVGNRSTGEMYFYLYNWVNRQGYGQSLVNIPVGRWFHVEAYYKQAPDMSGRVTVWQDGVLIFDKANVQTRYPDGTVEWSVNNYTDNISPATPTFFIDDAVISNAQIGGQ